jgi:hypothetical protein
LAGWLYLYVASEWFFIALGLATLAAGVAAFLLWSWRTGGWPFAGAKVGDRDLQTDKIF